MADTGYEPQVIADTPLPLLGLSDTNTSLQSPTPLSNDGTEPLAIKGSTIAPSPIAADIIGTSLDTNQRKILGSFSFGQVGAIKVGNYSPGVSGEIDISPSGVVAKNASGITTFDIDATTGDATFRGTVEAGNFVVVDEQGLRSISSFQGGKLTSATPHSTTNQTYIDVPGSLFTITNTRQLRVYFSIFAYLHMQLGEFGKNGWTCSAQLYDTFLNGLALGTLTSGGIDVEHNEFAPGFTGVTQYRSIMGAGIQISALLTVDPGTHNYTLQFKRDNSGGTGTIDSFTISFLILGT